MDSKITIDSLPGIDVWHGYTADGPRQVVVTLATSDAAGIGEARAVVDIREDTTPVRIAQIAHEQALALLAHELLEGLRIDGEIAFDAHPGSVSDGLHCIPNEMSPGVISEFRRTREAIGLAREIHTSVVIPADHSHNGESRRAEKPVDCGIAEIVRRLNHPVFGDAPITAGCCSGHGTEPPHIIMASGEHWTGECSDSGAEPVSHSTFSGPVALARVSHARERAMHRSVVAWGSLSDQARADKAEGALLVIDLVCKSLADVCEPHVVHTAIAEFAGTETFDWILKHNEG
jgi:hypothetical protein